MDNFIFPLAALVHQWQY